MISLSENDLQLVIFRFQEGEPIEKVISPKKRERINITLFAGSWTIHRVTVTFKVTHRMQVTHEKLAKVIKEFKRTVSVVDASTSCRQKGNDISLRKWQSVKSVLCGLQFSDIWWANNNKWHP